MELVMKVYVLRTVIALIATSISAFVLITESVSRGPGPSSPLTVAFIGDQGSNDEARAVLRLINDEGADLVLHQGDLDYQNDPEGWDRLITNVLGDDFPYFATVGNHDTERWYAPNGYQAKLWARLNKIGEVRCSGDLGVRSACSYRGLFFIQSGVGTMPKTPDHPGHVSFIHNELTRSDAVWRICSWHKNQNAMQVGGKEDEVGWGPYEACRKGGAIVATGHEHSYSRTHLMDNFEALSIASTSRTLEIEKGKSVAFVSGLGGRNIRKQKRGGAWWAATYTLDQGANFGALFCTFFADGTPDRADCYFKDINGNVPDRFELISHVRRPT
jgi:hypothetical protein